MAEFDSNNRQNPHYTTYPFALAAGDAGGLPSVFLKESTHAGSDFELNILSTDAEPRQVGNARIHPAEPEETEHIGNKFMYWFHTGCWQYLHPDAHTTVAASAQAIESMYAPELVEELKNENEAAAASEVGSLDFLLRYLEKYAPGRESHRSFNSKFERLIADIPPASVVNWQDYFFEPSVNQFARVLRHKGCFQTFHLHTTLPDSLNLSNWGRNLLVAMSRVDRVFVHTEEYRQRLELQLEALDLPVPEIRRFDLGIDIDHIHQSLAELNEGNFQQSQAYRRLTPEQQAFMDEVFRSRSTVPHRFACLDRVDPNKGVDVVLSAVEGFLRDKRQEIGFQQLQRSFRFFFLFDQFDKGTSVADMPIDSMKSRYSGYVSTHVAEIEKEFPGVVFVAKSINGASRPLLPHVMLGSHIITGGPQDGLNLAVQESLYANRSSSQSALIGSGAGFAMRLNEASVPLGGVQIVPAGRVDLFRESFHKVVKTAEVSPDAFLDSKRDVVRFIEGRKDSVIVSK